MRVTIVKLPRMEKTEIENFIRNQSLCRIAFRGDQYPYVVPFQYVLINNSLYFHFTDYGRKIQLLEKDKRVCVEIESYTPDLSEYKFAVLEGSLQLVDDPKERKRAIMKMATIGKEKLSINFLTAHGLKKEEGWDSLSPEKPLTIIKLVDVERIIGLKS